MSAAPQVRAEKADSPTLPSGDVSLNPYDAVPYESYPYDFTQPERMHAIGRLFGMTPAGIRTARVLELGCAAGGNLLPVAVRYPKAQFVGVDFSAVQIDRARKTAAALDARNVEFHKLSIADITAELGQFDYIICHGVLSWVPGSVRDAIFKVFERNLAPNGIALLSYNTLPGWRQVQALRDMMRYHCARFTDPVEKVAQGIALLRFVLDGAHESQTAYRDMIQREIDLLANQHESYIMHDHLEETNHAMHLHEVVDMARAAGLQYVGDSNLEIMYPNNFSQKVAQTLAAVDDIVRIEQYLDFVANRRFRTSLFCGGQNVLKRNLDQAAILDFCLGSRLQPPSAPIDLSRDSREVFKTASGTEVTTDNRYAAALMLVLSTMGQRVMSAQDIVREAAMRTGPQVAAQGGVEEGIRTVLVDLGLKMVFAGILTLHAEPSTAAIDTPTRPEAFAPARIAVQRGASIVPTHYHQRVSLTPAERVVIAACDGSRNLPALVDELVKHIQSGELSLQNNGLPVADPNSARADLATWLRHALPQLTRVGLISPP